MLWHQLGQKAKLVAFFMLLELVCCTSTSKATNVLLQLPRPFSSADIVRTTLLDDKCILCAVQRTSGHLLILVDCEQYNNIEQSDIASKIYSSAWESACATGNPNLEITLLFSDLLGLKGSVDKRLPKSIPCPDLLLGVSEDDAQHFLMRFDGNMSNSCHFESISGLVASEIDDLADVIFLDNPCSPPPLLLRRIAIGGTFDRLHCGHKKLLTAAAVRTPHPAPQVAILTWS
jgi:hypothetical protein